MVRWRFMRGKGGKEKQESLFESELQQADAGRIALAIIGNKTCTAPADGGQIRWKIRGWIMTEERQAHVMLQVTLVRAEYMGKINASGCAAANGSAVVVDD